MLFLALLAPMMRWAANNPFVKRPKQEEPEEPEPVIGPDDVDPALEEELANEEKEKELDMDDPANWKVKHRYLPIVSGLACPFGVLLDIPGLTTRWYVKTLGIVVIETQPNPIVLDVALAASIAFGGVATLALICRFLERKVLLFTRIAIVALTIHDVINVSAIVAFGVIHAVNDGFTYGEAFYMTIAATAASLLCNVTLVVDLVRTKDFARSGSGLTEKQRSLVIAVMALLCYVGIGSLVYSLLLQLSYINSLYFIIVTITSVGFGDISPTTLATQILSLFYDVFGLILVAFTIAVGRETVIETFETSYRKRREVLAVRAKERKEERRQKAKERRERKELEAQGLVPVQNVVAAGMSSGGGRGGAGGRLGTEDYDRDDFAEGVSAGKRFIITQFQKVGWLQNWEARRRSKKKKAEFDEHGNEIEDNYKSFKMQLAEEQKKEFNIKLSVALVLFLVFWLVGAAIFSLTEGWTYFIGLYFCFIFFTTIGYGDYSPKSNIGRAIFVAYGLLAIGCMTLLLSVLTETWSSKYKSTITESKMKRTLRKYRGGDKTAEHADATVRELLGEDEVIAPKDVPAKLVSLAKSFHEHASFFMHGRTGDTPESLRSLIEATDEMDGEIEEMKAAGVALAESEAHGEKTHFLFMVSYERTFDNMTATAEQLVDMFAAHAEELATLKSLNASLREALAGQGNISARSDSGSATESVKDSSVISEYHEVNSMPALSLHTAVSHSSLLARADAVLGLHTESTARPSTPTLSHPHFVDEEEHASPLRSTEVAIAVPTTVVRRARADSVVTPVKESR